MRRFFFLLLLAATTLSGCSKSDQPADLVTSVRSDDPAMNAAIDRARSEVDVFIKILDAGDADSYSVKVPITDHGKTEHFWLSNITYADGLFTGSIDNTPEVVSNVKMGQQITVKKTEISDWLYMKNGKMYGNYTVRVLLPKMPPEDAAKIRAMLVE